MLFKIRNILFISSFKLLLTVALIFCVQFVICSNSKNVDEQQLTETEILLIYEKSSDAIENFLFYLNAYKEDEISSEEAEKITEEILLRFTEKAIIFSDLNAENIDFTTSPTTSVDISDYLIQFRGQSGIKGVLSDRQELGYELTLPVYNGKNYILRVSFNKEIKGTDRKGENYQRTKQLATIVVEKIDGQFNALIQEISFLKPNQDYGFLPESASKAIRDAAFAKLQMKQSGNDSLYKIDEGALNSVLNSIASELNQSQKIYSQYLVKTKKLIQQLDFVNAAREIDKARKIQQHGAEYLSLKAELDEKTEQHANKIFNQIKGALNRLEYDRVIPLGDELISLGADENLLAPYINEANTGISRWNQLTTVKADNSNLDHQIAVLNSNLNAGDYSGNPDFLAEAHAAIAHLLLRKKDNNSATLAKQHIENALNTKKNYSRAKLMLLELDNTPENAIQTYTELISFDKDNAQLYLTRANYFSNKQDYKSAISDVEHAVALKPLDLTIRKKLAYLYLRISDYNSAIEQYSILNSINNEPINSVYKTYAYLEINQNDSAIIEKKNYETFSSASLDSLVQNYYDNALRLMGYSAYAEASTIFDKIYILVGHQNQHADYWHTAAQCHYYLKNNIKAQEFLLLAIGIYPSHFEANKLNGEIYLNAKDFKNAKETFEKCLEIRKGDYQVTKLLADTYFNEGKYFFEANNYYTKALLIAEPDKNLKNEVYQLKIQMAKCARMIDQLDEAIKLCDEAIKLNDKLPEAYFEQGLAFGKKPEESQVKKGLKQIEKALELLYDQSKCFKAMAEIQLRLKNYSAAQAEYQKLERINNYNFLAEDYIISAKINEGLNKPTDALSDLYKALKEDTTLSNDDTFLMQFSLVRIKHGVNTNTKKDIEDSKITIESVLRNNREDPRIYLIYSIYHYYMGNVPDAVEMLKTSLNFDLKVSAAENDEFIKSFLKEDSQIKQVLKQK
jgi:tetratricopeptide (TPR) repeat protein